MAPYPYETEFPSLDLDRPEDGILRLTLRAPGRLNAVSEAQHGELAHQSRQDVAKAVDGLLVGPLDLIGGAERLDQKVDRPVLQVQAAPLMGAGQEGRDHLSTRTLLARSTSSSVTAREA